MNLVKWLRKNNKKIMAIVVVVIMFGFIAGPTLRYFARISSTRHQAVAYFDDNQKITTNDLMSAQLELEILKLLQADILLRTQDLGAVLLGELLFSEQRTSPALINYIKRTIKTNGLRISDRQITNLYKRSMPAVYYWLLLKYEAQNAGIRVSKQQAGKQLGRIIPQLFKGTTYSQLIQSLINRQGIPEQQILTTFGRLLAVLQYAHMICSNEDVTIPQIRHIASWENETVNAELLKFDASVFARNLPEPNETRMVEHFNKYKKFFAGDVSPENPYGFGYKLPDRVQLEYILVKLDDVSKIVTHPTNQEKEQYYRENIDQFTTSVPSDPNDPNSPPVQRRKSYAEVESFISETLLQEKINSQAVKILQEAKALTEAGLENANTEPANLTPQQRRQMTGDYKTIAQKLSQKYKMKIYAGQTGLLSASDMQNDKNLAVLYLSGQGYSPVSLTEIVFAIDQLKKSELGPFSDLLKRQLYENIGPLRDIFGQIMAVVRVIKAEPAAEPESINLTYSINKLILDPHPESEGEDVYSVRKIVAEDLKNLAAMETARNKAQQFIELAENNGWDRAINQFNQLYGQQAKKDPNDPNVFRLQNLTDLIGYNRRISNDTLATLALQTAGNPAAQFIINQQRIRAQFVQKLYCLVPQDSNTADNLPQVLEFKPDMSFYCLKDISVKRLNQDEYKKIKTSRFFQQERIQSQSMAAVHFDPENILKRMNFRLAKKAQRTADANAPTKSG